MKIIVMMRKYYPGATTALQRAREIRLAQQHVSTSNKLFTFVCAFPQTYIVDSRSYSKQLSDKGTSEIIEELWEQHLLNSKGFTPDTAWWIVTMITHCNIKTM